MTDPFHIPDVLRQPRKKARHYDVPGDAHFVTFSCYRRIVLLSKDRTREWLVQSLAKARLAHNFDLWAWVIMPEHVHLLLYPRDRIYKMSKIGWRIKQPVGRKAIRWLKKHSPGFLDSLTVLNKNRTYHRFWQAGPGFDRNLSELTSLLEVIDYIYFNPVRRGLVERPEDWFWSSAAEWSGRSETPLPVDKTLPLIFESLR